MYKMFLLLIISVGCRDQHSLLDEAIYNKKAVPRYTEPLLKPYIDDFYRLVDGNGLGRGHRDNIHIIQYVETLGQKNAGVCRYETVIYRNGKEEDVRAIEIIKNDYGVMQKKELIYHELAHCVYDVQHTKDEKSIMSPTMHQEGFLEDHWEELIVGLIEEIRLTNEANND